MGTLKVISKSVGYLLHCCLHQLHLATWGLNELSVQVAGAAARATVLAVLVAVELHPGWEDDSGAHNAGQ